jgi:hypothetical protein
MPASIGRGMKMKRNNASIKLARNVIMKPHSACIFFFFLILGFQSNAQDFTWAKEVTGKLFAPSPNSPNQQSVPDLKIKEAFNIINQIPAIANPRGYNIQEWFKNPEAKPIYSTTLLINFYYYYRYLNGPVQLLDAHPPTISIAINDLEQLMNSQSTELKEVTEALHLPVMFRDTFPITHKTINDCPAGEGIYKTYGRSIKFWVLNPKGLRFFRPVTREEYWKAYIEYLKREIETGTKGLVEGKEALEQMKNNELLKKGVADFEDIQNAMAKWIAFEKSKKEYYEKKLASLAPEEKKAPAIYGIYKDPANIKDRNGNYVEKIAGHLTYEPWEDSKDTILTVPLFTFQEKAFDPKLPKTAFQLIVISSSYDEDGKGHLKELFDKEVFPKLQLKQLAALMYR